MTSVASQLIEEVTAHAQSDSLDDARETCADGTYFPNNLRTTILQRNVYILAILRCKLYKKWLMWFTRMVYCFGLIP